MVAEHIVIIITSFTSAALLLLFIHFMFGRHSVGEMKLIIIIRFSAAVVTETILW